jgi:uncharacterized protein (TIGR02996 family)
VTDVDALYVAVLDQPEEDTPRLALADALDERGAPGDCDRAEFIRLQIEIAEIRKWCGCGGCVATRGGGQHHNGPCAINRRDDDGVHRHRSKRLGELWLLGESVLGWAGNGLHNTPWEYFPKQDPDGPYVLWRRGFPDKIIGTRRQLFGQYVCGKCCVYAGKGKIPDDHNVRNPTWLTCDLCDGTRYQNPSDDVLRLYRSAPLTDVKISDLEPDLGVHTGEWVLRPNTYYPLERSAASLPDALWDVMTDPSFLAERSGHLRRSTWVGAFILTSPKIELQQDVRDAALIYIRSLRKRNG